MKPDGTFDPDAPYDAVVRIKEILINGVKNNRIVEACEEDRWAILLTEEWDDKKGQPIFKRLENVDVKFVFENAE